MIRRCDGRRFFSLSLLTTCVRRRRGSRSILPFFPLSPLPTLENSPPGFLLYLFECVLNGMCVRRVREGGRVRGRVGSNFSSVPFHGHFAGIGFVSYFIYIYFLCTCETHSGSWKMKICHVQSCMKASINEVKVLLATFAFSIDSLPFELH